MRGTSRYYNLPEGDLGATTVKELAPLHSRQDPFHCSQAKAAIQNNAIYYGIHDVIAYRS